MDIKKHINNAKKLSESIIKGEKGKFLKVAGICIAIGTAIPGFLVYVGAGTALIVDKCTGTAHKTEQVIQVDVDTISTTLNPTKSQLDK